jgi:hypothetical protein
MSSRDDEFGDAIGGLVLMVFFVVAVLGSYYGFIMSTKFMASTNEKQVRRCNADLLKCHAIAIGTVTLPDGSKGSSVSFSLRDEPLILGGISNRCKGGFDTIQRNQAENSSVVSMVYKCD